MQTRYRSKTNHNRYFLLLKASWRSGRCAGITGVRWANFLHLWTADYGTPQSYEQLTGNTYARVSK